MIIKIAIILKSINIKLVRFPSWGSIPKTAPRFSTKVSLKKFPKTGIGSVPIFANRFLIAIFEN
jgi:hypothetical protein